MAERVDLGQIAGPADERVVGGDAAVVVEADDLADVGARVLGALSRRPGPDGPADRHVHLAVGAERDPRGGDAPAEALGDEDVADFRQRPAVEPAAGEGDRRAPAAVLLHRLRVGQINEPVVVRVEGDVHQAGEPRAQIDLGHPGNRPRIEHAVPDQPQGARVALGDEDVAVGAERQPPGMREPGRHRHDPDARLLGAVEHHRPLGQGHRRHPAQGGGALADLGRRDRAAARFDSGDRERADGERQHRRRTAAGAGLHGATSVRETAHWQARRPTPAQSPAPAPQRCGLPEQVRSGGQVELRARLPGCSPPPKCGSFEREHLRRRFSQYGAVHVQKSRLVRQDHPTLRHRREQAESRWVLGRRDVRNRGSHAAPAGRQDSGDPRIGGGPSRAVSVGCPWLVRSRIPPRDVRRAGRGSRLSPDEPKGPPRR